MVSDALPQGFAARRAALRLLDAVLRRGLPLEAALDAAAADVERADDRAFVRLLAAETLRRLTDLDALIDGATAKRLPGDAKARAALRLALVQALALGTPAHAAIATVLPLVDGGPRRLVHGVFSAILDKGVVLPEPPSLPPAVTARWKKRYGGPAVRAAREMAAVPPPIDLSLKPNEPGPGGETLLADHVRLPRGSAVSELPGYAAGGWWVQDIAASLPARLIGAGCGTALDLCAAPGGKTLQLAAAGWQVTAVDLSERRLDRLRENLVRTRLAAEIVTADIMRWEPPAPADAVLLDAPCSATGIFRRHPDVLHRATPRAIAELAEGQAAMLVRAAEWVKPGGMLVYAVCSAEPSEGEAVADGFRSKGLAPEPVDPAMLPAGFSPDAKGRIRVPPGALADRGGADAFFVARWRRIG